MSAKERRERERELRREQILDAARGLLLKKGMAAISMNMIARKAELGVGTLYLYFKSKEELFAELQEEGLNLLHDAIRSTRESTVAPQDQLFAVAAAYIDFARTQRAYFEIINYFLSSPEVSFPEEIKKRIDEHGSRILGEVVMVLGTLREEAPQAELRRGAVSFWAGLQGMLQLRKLQTTVLSGETLESLITYQIENFVRGFMAIR